MKAWMILLLLGIAPGPVFPADAGQPHDKAVEFNSMATQYGQDGQLPPTHLAGIPDRQVFFKIEQGLVFSRLLDQRMSNLHYTGPGLSLAFSRYVISPEHHSALSFARIGFQYAQPAHEGTQVYNPAFGIRYMHMRKMKGSWPFTLHLGGQADVFANIRIIPALSNSSMFSDVVMEVQPRGQIEIVPYLFDREWPIDFSLSFSLLAYGLQLPEYATIFQIGEDGSSRMNDADILLLHPGNYAHLVSGIFWHDSFGGERNPNRFRLGYVWDYYRINGSHGLRVYNASHRLVLQLFFQVN